MNEDPADDDELCFFVADFWPWVAACVLIARDGVTPPPGKGATWGEWFSETIASDRATALLAEVHAMAEEERGMWVMRALGEYDA